VSVIGFARDTEPNMMQGTCLDAARVFVGTNAIATAINTRIQKTLANMAMRQKMTDKHQYADAYNSRTSQETTVIIAVLILDFHKE
jgi:hypothetical protein